MMVPTLIIRKKFFKISEKLKNQQLRYIRELRSQSKLSLRKLGENANTENHDLPGAEATEDTTDRSPKSFWWTAADQVWSRLKVRFLQAQYKGSPHSFVSFTLGNTTRFSLERLEHPLSSTLIPQIFKQIKGKSNHFENSLGKVIILKFIIPNYTSDT